MTGALLTADREKGDGPASSQKASCLAQRKAPWNKKCNLASTLDSPTTKQRRGSHLQELWFVRRASDSVATGVGRLIAQFDEALLHIELPEDDEETDTAGYTAG